MPSDYIHLVPSSDVDVDKPDEKSIMTYVAQFLKHHPDRKQSDSDGQQEDEEVSSCQIYFSVWIRHSCLLALCVLCVLSFPSDVTVSMSHHDIF